MTTVHTRYVTWISRGRRHHGSAAMDIVSPLNTVAASPGVYQAWASPQISWNDGDGEHTASFAFWSVTGAQDGAFIGSNPSLAVSVGATDIAATAWYLPTGGGGGGEPGIFIDAFDVNAGMFVDDDFVSVTPDAGLTAAANNDGFVPTTALEHIIAYNSIHAVPFDKWMVVAGTETVANTDLTAGAESSAVAFAFYFSPTITIKPPTVYQAGTWVSFGVTVDGGGPTGAGPVPPWNPLLRQIAAGFAFAEAGGLLHPELQRAALEIAAKQITMTADEIARRMQGGGE